MIVLLAALSLAGLIFAIVYSRLRKQQSDEEFQSIFKRLDEASSVTQERKNRGW